jgi:phage shock protein C
MPGTALTRPARGRGRLLAGVCAGIARRFGLSPWLVRGAFLLSCLLPGPQILLYVLLWIAMPRDP